MPEQKPSVYFTSRGSSTLSGGTKVVSDTKVTANSIILISPVGISLAGALGVTLNPGVGFTVDSLGLTDARDFTYIIAEPI